MRADVTLTSFSKGEVSPRLKGRIDYKGYYDACEELLNMVVLPQGGLTRRPGTLYSANVKDQTTAPHLVPFQFKTTQAYMLEFGPDYIRVYKDKAPVTNVLTVTGAANNGAGLIRLTVASTAGLYDNNTAVVAGVGGVPNATGTWLIDVIDSTHFDLLSSTFSGSYTTGGTATVTVEIPTTYAANELTPLEFTQSADTLYIFSPTHKPATLTRSSHTNWTLADIAFLDGPYLDENTTSTTLTAGGTSGSVSLTASSTTGINGDAGFKSTDVGRIVRLFDGGWSWLKITAVGGTTSATATVQDAVNNGAGGTATTNATKRWRLGKWSDTTGWPYLPTFWQQRLMTAGTDNQPNAIDGSQTGDFVNFAPTKGDNSVIDTNALSWILSDDQVNSMRWLSAAGSAQAMQLGMGTDGSEHILQAATTSQALTPTSVQAYRETTFGAKAYVNALRIGKAVLFANAAGRKILEWQFDWQVNGYRGIDRTVDSEHITHPLIRDMAYQKNQLGIVWVLLEDGTLAGFTYLPEQQVFAFHRHVLGGNYYGGNAVVESIAVIPATDQTYDELWLAVKRTVNGAVVRYVEVMADYFDAETQDKALFVDAALQSTLTTPAATCTPSSLSGAVTFTATAGAPFAAGNVGSILRINGGIALISTFTSSSVIAGNWFTGLEPTSLAPAAAGDWSLTAQNSTFSGLTHLIGESVSILGDGADFGLTTVDNSGAVALSGAKASFATIGLPVDFRFVGLPDVPQAAPAAAGKTKTTAKLYLRLLRSLGCDFGRRMTDPMTGMQEDKTEPLPTRSAGDILGWAPALFSGIVRLSPQGSHDYEGQVMIKGTGPLPCTILSLIMLDDVGDIAPS